MDEKKEILDKAEEIIKKSNEIHETNTEIKNKLPIFRQFQQSKEIKDVLDKLSLSNKIIPIGYNYKNVLNTTNAEKMLDVMSLDKIDPSEFAKLNKFKNEEDKKTFEELEKEFKENFQKVEDLMKRYKEFFEEFLDKTPFKLVNKDNAYYAFCFGKILYLSKFEKTKNKKGGTKYLFEAARAGNTEAIEFCTIKNINY